MNDLQKDLVERFTRYAKIDSQVDPSKAGMQCPTNPKELDMSRLLAAELKELGLEVYADDKGFVIGKLKGSKPAAPIALMAHIDTAEGVPGWNVQPIVHENYDGKPIALKDGIMLDPKTNPQLAKYKGTTIITSDGSTLLGGDDKAGVAAIMGAIRYLVQHPEIERGDLEAVFTPDEEGGDGMSHFPLKQLAASYAYTIDGNAEGEVEYECYNAYTANIVFKGVSYHPGDARGRLVNAVSMAAAFINLLPRNESPEATDGYYGCYWPDAIKGHIEQAELAVYVRDHDDAQAQRRLAALKSFALAVEAAFPGGKAEVSTSESYRNMREEVEKKPEVMERLYQAMQRVGVQPIIKPIRGGTDGARLTQMGVPCPNIFTGAHNCHGRSEWVAAETMEKACRIAIELAKG